MTRIKATTLKLIKKNLRKKITWTSPHSPFVEVHSGKLSAISMLRYSRIERLTYSRFMSWRAMKSPSVKSNTIRLKPKINIRIFLGFFIRIEIFSVFKFQVYYYLKLINLLNMPTRDWQKKQARINS